MTKPPMYRYHLLQDFTVPERNRLVALYNVVWHDMCGRWDRAADGLE